MPLYVDADGDCAHEFWEENEAGHGALLHSPCWHFAACRLGS